MTQQLKTMPDTNERKDVRAGFDAVVNMTAGELSTWLATDESKSVGQHPDGEKESIGHQSGEQIVKLLGKKATDLTDDDYVQMRRVIGYVKRHSAQQPDKVAGSNWEYSLKNWGHDPEKA